MDLKRTEVSVFRLKYTCQKPPKKLAKLTCEQSAVANADDSLQTNAAAGSRTASEDAGSIAAVRLLFTGPPCVPLPVRQHAPAH